MVTDITLVFFAQIEIIYTPWITSCEMCQFENQFYVTKKQTDNEINRSNCH